MNGKLPAAASPAIKSGARDEINDILQAIERTDKIAEEKSNARKLVLVIGNTGAGKSVFVNYLLGNDLVEERFPNSLTKGFKLRNPTEADPEIGFGFASKTDFPGFYNDPSSDLTFCDCPGFFDNRGAVFDISNMYALAKMADTATCLKGVVVLINYHSLLADRARGLHETVGLLGHIFGKSALKNSPSILLLISQTPGDLELKTLQDFMGDASQQFPFLKGIVEKCEQYDALDRYCHDPLNRISRAEIIARLHKFPGIAKEGLNIALSPDSICSLDAMMQVLKTEATEAFDMRDPKIVNSFLGTLRGLKILRCSTVSECEGAFMQHMTLKVSEWSSDLSNLDMLNDLKVEIGEIEDVVHIAVKQMLERIDAEKKLKHKVDVAESDLLLAKTECKAYELKVAAAQAEVASEKEKLRVETEKHRAEAEKLRAEAQRVQVQPQGDIGNSIFALLIRQLIEGRGQQQQHFGSPMQPQMHPMTMPQFPGMPQQDLSDQFAGMSFGGRSSQRSQPAGRSNMVYVRPYTRSNGTQVNGHYRRSPGKGK